MTRKTIKTKLRRARTATRVAKRVLVGKLQGVIWGRSPISPSCQISNLREVLLSAGLKPRSGVFVEIGAFDGETFSNTSFLADQGWRGLYVEPVPEFCKRTKVRHILNSVVVLQAAIADEEGEMELTLMGPLTTSDVGIAQLYSETDWAKECWRQRSTCTVKTLPLKSALELAGTPKKFDLLVVDVEGCEERIIEQLLQSEYRPTVAIIELQDQHPSFAEHAQTRHSHERVRSRMHEEGYVPLYQDKINTVFFRGTPTPVNNATRTGFGNKRSSR